jgi:hypothetical protein
VTSGENSSVVFVTADLAGGQFGPARDERPQPPDGIVDWIFIVLLPAHQDVTFKGDGRLDLSDLSTSPASLTIASNNGARLTFVVSASNPSDPGKRVLPACWITRTWTAQSAKFSHAKAVEFLESRPWGSGNYWGPPCPAPEAFPPNL